MDFLSWEWIYAAPALLGALVILYFLKLKRRDVAVSSTYLWKKALEDLRVNSPFQRLRMNVLLLLQLLVLASLLFALARPIASVTGLSGRTLVILVDRSASMNSTDADGPGKGKTRLQRAVDEAKRLVDGMGLGDTAAIVAFDEQAEILALPTDQKPVLLEALKAIQATDRRTNLKPAIENARTLLGKNPQEPVVTIISDGCFGSLRDVGIPKNVDVHFVRMGEVADNFAIASLEVRRAFEGGEASRVFATVFSSHSEKKTVGIDCFLEEELIASKEVDVPPHEQTSVVFESPKLRKGRLRVAIDSQVQDAFPTDDVAYAVLREKKDVKILIVTEGNPFIERALEGDPLVRKDGNGHVPRLEPSQFSAEDPSLKEFDLIVLDRVEPRVLPAGNYLMIDALPPFEGLMPKGTLEKPSVVDWDEAHAVTRFVSFASLDLTLARRVALRKEDKIVVGGTQGGEHGTRKPKKKPGEKVEEDEGVAPLVFEARDGERHVLVLAFDLMKTQSWPLKAAFPIFMANVVRWLGGAGRDERSLACRTGEVVEVPAPKSATKVTVTDPLGRERGLVLKGDDVVRFADTATAGFYAVKFEGGESDKAAAHFAANLASTDESEIGPAAKIELEGLPIQAEEKAQNARQELWKIFAVAAFVVLMIEWWVYNRRVYV